VQEVASSRSDDPADHFRIEFKRLRTEFGGGEAKHDILIGLQRPLGFEHSAPLGHASQGLLH